METLFAYQSSSALKGAIDLDVFTAIAEGNASAPDIAKRCNASERGIRILCDFLTTQEFLTKSGDRYQLAPDAAVFLNRRSPAFVGDAAKFLCGETMLDHFRDAAAFVRKGGCAVDADANTAPDHPVWVDFARAMGPLMSLPASLIADRIVPGTPEPWKVLDIAAGHGLFGITLAQRNPNAHIVALDWPNVLEVAQENARKAGVADRYQTIPGSAFDADFGTGYDVVLLTNFLHHFDPPTCEALLRKVHASMKPGGWAITLEFVPNDDKVSPAGAAMFSFVMLASTPAGEAYSFQEFDRMFRNAGFSKSEIQPLPPTEESVIISTK